MAPRKASSPAVDAGLEPTRRGRRSWPDATDEAVVEACLDGDDGAWKVLVERYGSLVHAICLHWGLASDEAADVFQTVFLIVYRKIGLLDSPGSLGGWIGTISRREAWRAMRGRRARETLEGLPIDAVALPATEPPPPDESLEQVERAFLVQRGLARIDERCRRLLESLFWEQPRPSYKEVASRLGIQAVSMPPTRARCLAKLRRALEELGW